MSCNNLSVRYGSTKIIAGTASTSATGVEIFVGNPGDAPVISKSSTVTDGTFTIELSATDTQVPLGKYHYQFNLTIDGKPYKFPSDSRCRSADLPTFTVLEALDETEVV